MDHCRSPVLLIVTLALLALHAPSLASGGVFTVPKLPKLPDQQHELERTPYANLLNIVERDAFPSPESIDAALQVITDTTFMAGYSIPNDMARSSTYTVVNSEGSTYDKYRAYCNSDTPVNRLLDYTFEKGVFTFPFSTFKSVTYKVSDQKARELKYDPPKTKDVLEAFDAALDDADWTDFHWHSLRFAVNMMQHCPPRRKISKLFNKSKLFKGNPAHLRLALEVLVKWSAPARKTSIVRT